MKVIISGASGFVGSHLVNECVSNGIETTCIVREMGSATRINSQAKYVALSDLVDPLCIEKVIGHADCFFHFAWSGTSGNARMDLNRQLKNICTLKECVDIAAQCGCAKFINAGSIMEYELANRWTDSEAGYAMSDIYSAAKLCADLIGRIVTSGTNINYINLIISNIYGPNELSERFVYSVLKKMIQNEKIPLTKCDQPYDFIYISDAISAMVKVAVNGTKGNYYIGNSEQHPLRYYVEKMKDLTGSKSELCFGAVENKSSYSVYDSLDCARLNKELKFTPEVSFDAGIRETAEYIKELL